jgi:WD40 repeat protein
MSDTLSSHSAITLLFLVNVRCSSLSYSNYPSRRVTIDADGNEMGIIGTASLLQNTALCTQPISSLDWSPDKEGIAVCTSFDQTIRVIIATKLNTL